MNSPIRILHVVTSMNAGGIENMLMNLYRQINRDNVQFDFLLHTQESCFFEKEIESLGGNVFRISPLRMTALSAYNRELAVFFDKHNKYKIIHVHRSVWGYFVLKAAQKSNIPIRILHSHEAHKSIWEHQMFRIPMILTLKLLIDRYVTHRIACSTDAGIWLFGKNKEFLVLKNAIDTDKFKYIPSIACKVKSEFNLGDSIVIGHVGNFTKAKNYPFIIEIFKAIHERNSNVRLMLVGNNTNNIEVENSILEFGLRDKVIFTGVRSDIPDLLQAMDVFLFPSLFEGLPVTLVEAQATGLKIFASDTVTKEVAITDEINFLSLEESADFWANRILNSVPYIRNNNKNSIRDAGYDVVENAKWLENFYFKQIENIA